MLTMFEAELVDPLGNEEKQTMQFLTSRNSQSGWNLIVTHLFRNTQVSLALIGLTPGSSRYPRSFYVAHVSFLVLTVATSCNPHFPAIL